MSEVNTGKGGQVTYGRQGHVGTITLNRPDKRNALNPGVWDALDEAVALAEQDAEARVVLLRGEGKSFCAGLDLSPDNELFSVVSDAPSATNKVVFYREVRRVQAIHTRLEKLVKPTIAVMQRHCLGAGLELALMVRDVENKTDFFITFLIAGIGLATTNMGIAFFIGILVQGLIKWRRIEI